MNAFVSVATVGAVTRGRARALSRRDLFAGLAILGCVNGLAGKVIGSISENGWLETFFSATNVSVIVWAACACGVGLLLRDRGGEASKTDLMFAAPYTALVCLPSGELSWVALAGLCLYILRVSDSLATRQGAVILLATTVPMVWSLLLFKLFGNTILMLDATLVSHLLGTSRDGNVVEFADGSGDLVILRACSSLANVSHAMLCWVTISRSINHARTPRDWLWCACACACVIAVNVIRMALMGMSLPMYEAIHGDVGNAIASAIMLGLTIGVCLLGVRRELFARV